MSIFKLRHLSIVTVVALVAPLIALHAQISIGLPGCYVDGPSEEGITINAAKKMCAQYYSCSGWGGDRTVVPLGWTKYDLSCNSGSRKPELLQRCTGDTMNQIDVQQCCAAIGYAYTVLNTTPCLTLQDQLIRYILPSAIFICSLLFAMVALSIKRIVTRKPLQKKWREFIIYWVIGIILATIVIMWLYGSMGIII